jgi:glycosyltransferase involved in cell wall biosynthesis
LHFFEENKIEYKEIIDKIKLRYGILPSFFERLYNLRRIYKIFNIYRNTPHIIWTTTEGSVAYLGMRISNYNHVMQLMELYEDIYIKSRVPLKKKVRIATIAKKAKAVVVPEYNRAHIQKAWWGLSILPFILHNIPVYHPIKKNLPIQDKQARQIVNSIVNSGKKIILYQGIINKQRNISPIIEEITSKNSLYSICIMGLVDQDILSKIEKNKDVYILPWQIPPHHLEITSWAEIGIMIYEPVNASWRTPLNALFCAPNKLFEYTGFGIPIITNDCPSLRLDFELSNIGSIVDINNPESIKIGLKKIESNYNTISKCCVSFFEKANYIEELNSIVNYVTSKGK